MWNRYLMFEMSKRMKMRGHERRSELIWVEKPEVKLFIWINVHHHSRGFGVDVGKEESAIFTHICNSNSVRVHICCSDSLAGGSKSITTYD